MHEAHVQMHTENSRERYARCCTLGTQRRASRDSLMKSVGSTFQACVRPGCGGRRGKVDDGGGGSAPHPYRRLEVKKNKNTTFHTIPSDKLFILIKLMSEWIWGAAVRRSGLFLLQYICICQHNWKNKKVCMGLSACVCVCVCVLWHRMWKWSSVCCIVLIIRFLFVAYGFVCVFYNLFVCLSVVVVLVSRRLDDLPQKPDVWTSRASESTAWKKLEMHKANIGNNTKAPGMTSGHKSSCTKDDADNNTCCRTHTLEKGHAADNIVFLSTPLIIHKKKQQAEEHSIVIAS